MNRNPYATFVEGRDLVESLEQVPQTIERLVRAWPRERDERSHAPGKWTARQILVHLAQSEMVFSNRLRFAVAADDYIIQPFDQDRWMEAEAPVSALDALDAYVAVRRMNLALCRSLDAARLARPVRHPEVGEITVEWIVAFFAGHERNHLPQIETIAR
jgi:uncharacterized damage-inducible protein DinB